MQAVNYDPFPGGREVEDFAETTEAQREIWTTIALEGVPANLSYNQAFVFRFRGQMSTKAMEQALQQVALRNDALRTAFSSDGRWMSVIRGQGMPFVYEDLSDLELEQRHARRQIIAENEVSAPFDLISGPVARATLIKLDDELHELFFTSHHMVADGWSIGVVLQQLSSAYNAALSGSPSIVPARSFLSYARQEAAFAKSDAIKSHLAYWQSQYQQEPVFLDLPRDGSEDKNGPSELEAGRYDHVLDANLVDRLRIYSNEHRVSLFISFLAAFEAYLMRVCNQSQFSVGVPTAGQNVTGQDMLVGHCVNLLPIAFKLEKEATFTSHLKTVRSTFLDALEHQRVPLGQLVRELDLPRHAGRTPLSTVTFNFDSGTDAAAFDGLQFSMENLPRPYTQFPLSINVSNLRSGLSLECSYWKSKFSRNSMARRMREFELLLGHAIEAPQTSLDRLRLVSRDEHAATIERWNNTDASFDSANVIELFDRQAQVNAELPCSRYKDRTLTYQEVREQSLRVCHALALRGVKPGSRVAVVMNRTEELLPVLMGVMRAGCAYVPIDPTYPSSRVAKVLEDAAIDAAIAHDEHLELLRAEGRFVVGREMILCLGAHAAELSAQPAEKWRPPQIDKDACAYIIHTSGSTGRPKGVPTHHAALSNYLQAYQQRVTRYQPGDTALMVLSISFDGSIADLFVPLIAGACCAIADRDAALDPRVLIEHLDRFDVTSTLLTPSIWRSMLEQGWNGKQNLKAVTAGEAVSADLVAELLPKVDELWNGYGPTECTVITTMHRFESAELPIRIGKPIANYRCYILDENHQQVPVGVPGRLWIGGPGVSHGYLGRPELNAKKFMDDPFEPGEGNRLYDSGDRVRWLADGTMECLDRFDNQVKIRGYRMELGEIESVIRQASEVAEAIVGVAEVPKRGRSLVAFVRSENPETGTDELRRACRKVLTKHLPTYMIPSAIHRVDRFKLNPSGKVDRKALPFGDVDWGIPQDEQSAKAAARTPIEEALVAAWEEVLGHKPGIYDNFFSIGGGSLDAIRLVEHVHQRGLSLQPTDVMRSPTIAELGRLATLRTTSAGHTDTMVVLREEGSKPPLFVFHSVPGDLLHYGPLVQNLPADRPIYGLQGLSLIEQLGAEQWSIEELARCYAEQIDDVVGHRSCHLAGWCFGAHLALEVAAHRKDEGKGVGLVALLEAWPNRSAAAELLRDARLLAGQGMGAFARIQQKAENLLKEKQRQDPRSVFALEVQEGPFQHRAAVHDRNMAAIREHRSQAYDGPLLLIKSALEVSGQLEEPDYGWQEYATPGELQVEDIHAEHNDILLSPHVKRVAQVLQTAMTNAEHTGREIREQKRPTPTQEPGRAVASLL